MNKTIRNIMIVALFSVGGGWLGIWLNKISGNTQPPMQSLGALVWLVTPALSGILLRAIGGDGWKDAGFGLKLASGWKWYLVGLLLYPLAALLILGLALAIGAVSVDGFIRLGFGAYAAALGAAFAGSLVKNLFEEFAWRGYLTPRLAAAGVPGWVNHLIVGVLWWSWHLPYYLYFFDQTALQSYLTTSLPVFLLTGLVSLLFNAFLYGELRLLSKSVWPAYLLHTVINAVSTPLIFNGFLTANGVLGTIFAHTNESILTSIVLGGVGIGLYLYRVGKKQSPAIVASR